MSWRAGRYLRLSRDRDKGTTIGWRLVSNTAAMWPRRAARAPDLQVDVWRRGDSAKQVRRDERDHDMSLVKRTRAGTPISTCEKLRVRSRLDENCRRNFKSTPKRGCCAMSGHKVYNMSISYSAKNYDGTRMTTSFPSEHAEHGLLLSRTQRTLRHPEVLKVPTITIASSPRSRPRGSIPTSGQSARRTEM